MKLYLSTIRAALVAFAALSVFLVSMPAAHAQEAVSGETGPTSGATPSASGTGKTYTSAVNPGDVGAGVKKGLDKMNGLRSGLIQGASKLSEKTRTQADKFAFGFGVITLVLASLRFAATSDPVSAWTDLFDTLVIVGMFSSLYVGYTTFAPGIFVWFNDLATEINGGTDIYEVPMTLANTAGVFFEAISRALIAGYSNPFKFLDAIVQVVVLFLAFVALLITSLIYFWFIMLGHFQVAVGIALGPIAVSLGFSDYTRKYFTAWLDFMFSGAMYLVVSAVVAQLVSVSLISAINDTRMVGGDTVIGALYALSVAIMLMFVALEIPKMAGAVFGTGGGITGGGAMKMLGRGAWNLGGKLAGKK